MYTFSINTIETVNQHEAQKITILNNENIVKIIGKQVDDEYIHKLKLELKNFIDKLYIKRVFKFKDDMLCGRRYSQDFGLQNFNSNIRKLLGKNCNRELDMNNTFPTILLKLGNSINTPNLEFYIKNATEIRQNIINSGLSLKNTKELFYPSKPDTEISKIKDTNLKNLVINIRDEYKKIAYYLYNSVFYSSFKKYTNDPMKFVRLILMDIENILLEKVINYMNILQIPVRTLMFDGLIISHNNYPDQFLLDNLNKITSDFNLTWKFIY